tara:strand:- start:39 stop:347 length:309 start_codon:yes stop_codon:yes gene_type:complete
MKDKHTYTKLKEHGEDMSDENDTKIKAEDLPFLIDRYKKEIWDWKQKEADWIKTENLLNGAKNIIDELSTKLVQQARIIQDLQFNNNTYKKEIEKLLEEKKK